MGHRAIDAWIEERKKGVAKRSGPKWGVLVHGNRILAAAVFKRLGSSNFSKPIAEFPAWFMQAGYEALCEDSYNKMVAAVEQFYAGRFLAVLFKNPSMSKHVFDLATSA